MNIEVNVPDEIVITLRMTRLEAAVLKTLVGNVYGNLDGPRSVIDQLYHELDRPEHRIQDARAGSGWTSATAIPTWEEFQESLED